MGVDRDALGSLWGSIGVLWGLYNGQLGGSGPLSDPLGGSWDSFGDLCCICWDI